MNRFKVIDCLTVLTASMMLFIAILQLVGYNRNGSKTYLYLACINFFLAGVGFGLAMWRRGFNELKKAIEESTGKRI